MDAYLQARDAHRSANGQLHFTTSDVTQTLVTVKSSSHTIFIQKLYVTIKTDAAQTITFEDSNTSPVFVQKTDSSPGANTEYIWDFGPTGVPLTLGKNFVATFSAAGLAGHIEWYGYQRKTND